MNNLNNNIRAKRSELFKELADRNRELAQKFYSSAERIKSLTNNNSLIGGYIDCGIEAENKSKHYSNMAENDGFDINAYSNIHQVKRAYQELEDKRSKMKEINRHFIKFSHFIGIDISPQMMSEIRENLMLFRDNKPFPEISIRKTTEHMAKLKKLLKTFTIKKNTEVVIKGVKIIDNLQENRLQVFLPKDLLNHEIRILLNHFGFKENQNCWEKKRSNNSFCKVSKLIEIFCS